MVHRRSPAGDGRVGQPGVRPGTAISGALQICSSARHTTPGMINPNATHLAKNRPYRFMSIPYGSLRFIPDFSKPGEVGPHARGMAWSARACRRCRAPVTATKPGRALGFYLVQIANNASGWRRLFSIRIWPAYFLRNSWELSKTFPDLSIIIVNESPKTYHGGSRPLVAAIIGTSKFQYDLWGDTVNVASRMESHGLPGKIQISQASYELIKDEFDCASRGAVEIRGKEIQDTWFLVGRKR